MTDEPEDGCLCRGRYGQVRFARAKDSSLMAKSTWSEQDKAWQKAFSYLFLQICSDQNLRLNNREQFKQLQGDLFEFKRNGLKSRILAFREKDTWYLVDVFLEKKEDDLPSWVIDQGLARVQEAKAILAKLENQDRGQR